MNTPQPLPPVYTPEEVAKALKLSTNTVYSLISKGDIVAKRLGKNLRIPASSLSFMFTGLDADILQAQQEDEKNIDKIRHILDQVREETWQKTESF